MHLNTFDDALGLVAAISGWITMMAVGLLIYGAHQQLAVGVATLAGFVGFLAFRKRQKRHAALLTDSELDFHQSIRSTLSERFDGTWSVSESGNINGWLYFGELPMALRLVSANDSAYKVTVAVKGELPDPLTIVLISAERADARVLAEGDIPQRVEKRFGSLSALAAQMARLKLLELTIDDEGTLLARGEQESILPETIYPLIVGVASLFRRFGAEWIPARFSGEEICPYCKDSFDDQHPAVSCSVCNTRQHRECWSDHDDRCAVFGCGSGISLQDQ